MFKYTYTVHFLEIPARDIFNYCGPYTIDHFPICAEWKQKRRDHGLRFIKKKNEFYEDLRRSIKQHGIRNPILASLGAKCLLPFYDYPEELVTHLDSIPICDRLGGSRLLVAQELGCNVPVLLCDWTGNYSNLDNLNSPEKILPYFHDQPQRILFNQYGLYITK